MIFVEIVSVLDFFNLDVCSESNLPLEQALKWLSAPNLWESFWAIAVQANELIVDSIKTSNSHAVRSLNFSVEYGSYNEAVVGIFFFQRTKVLPVVFFSKVHDTALHHEAILSIQQLFHFESFHVEFVWGGAIGVV